MRRTTSILLLLIAFSFGMRVYLLGHQELRGDEGFSWNYVRGTPASILARIIREGDPQPPLHYWLLWSWVRLNGETEFALRFPSAFLSVLLVPLAYQVGRKLWRKEVGLFAAGLTAIHPQQLWLAQDARNMYLLALVALLLTLWLLPNLVQRGGLKNWLGYTACAALAVYSHYYAIFPLLAQAAYVIEARPLRRQLWQWLSAGATVTLCIAPWALMLLPIYSQGQLAEPGGRSLTQYTGAVFGESLAGPTIPQTFQSAAALLIGIIALIPFFTRTKWKLYLAASILIPFLGIYLVIGLRATFNAYYYVFAFPALVFLLANGWLILFQKARPIGAIALIGLVALYAIGLYNYYYDPRYSKTRGLREAAAYIAQSRQPGDGFLANFPDPVQGYYLRYLDLPYTMLPVDPRSTPAEIDQALARLGYRRTWFIPIKASQWDQNSYVQSRLMSTALLLDNQRFQKTPLLLFETPDLATPLNAQFADGITLVGYALAADRLTLVWQASATPSTDYTIFVHVLAANGLLVAQHDAPPSPPTSAWRPGQRIIDMHEISTPIDQPLILTAGLYKPDTGKRLKLASGSSPEPDAAIITAMAPK